MVYKKKYLAMITIFAQCIANFLHAAVIGEYSECTALTLDSSHKILSTGTVTIHKIPHMYVARYLDTGILDSSFNNVNPITNQGANTTCTGEASAYACAICTRTISGINQDKPIIAGESNKKFTVARFTTTGIPDSTFNETGYVTTAIGTHARILSITLDNHDSLFVAGFTVEHGDQKVALAKYTAQGKLDPSFGNHGVVVHPFGVRSQATGIALDAAGNILICGWFSDGLATERILLARFSPQGKLDPSFGASSGYTQTSLDGLAEHATSLAIDTNGNIVVTGFTNQSNKYHLVIARYTPNGILDTTRFNTPHGYRVTTLDAYSISGKAIVIDHQNNIVVLSETILNTKKCFILRYTAAGTLDPSFGINGIAQFGGNQAFLRSCIAAGTGPDSDYIAGGGNNLSSWLIRFTATGGLNHSFGPQSIGQTWDPYTTSTLNGTEIYLMDLKPPSAAGGTFMSGPPQTRTLNTIRGQGGWGIVTLFNNQFTLIPGNYELSVTAPAYNVGSHQLFLYNITHQSVATVGDRITSSGGSSIATLKTKLNLEQPTTYEVRHQCTKTCYIHGFGKTENITLENKAVYTQVTIKKINYCVDDFMNE